MSLYDHEEAVKKKAKMKQLHTKMLLENFLAKCIESKEKRKIQIKAEKVIKIQRMYIYTVFIVKMN